MKSRFLNSLESQIARSSGIVTPQLRAERAAYFARAGQVDEALEELASIRRECSTLSDSRLSAILNFAEGLCHYYNDFSPVAWDRFKRARALAQMGGHTDVAGRALSWLSLLAYSAHRPDEMCRYIDDCVDELRCRDSTALARTSLTIAMALHAANRFDLAMRWYRRAHLFAVDTRDEAMISAMLHNMAALWLTNSRNAALGGPPSSDRSRQALLGAISSFNFDDLVESTALGVLKPLLEAQLCSLESDFPRAVELYNKSEEEFPVEAVHNWASWMVADRVWCRLQCGVEADAIDILEAIEASLDKVNQVDEQAATLARLAMCWQSLGQAARARPLFERAKACWQQFEEFQIEVLRAVANSAGARRLAEEDPM